MKFVQPIRCQKKIEDLRKYLFSNPRNHLLFIIGISSAYRVSDLIQLKFNHVIDEDCNVRDYFQIRESKNHKVSRILIHPNVKDIIREYVSSHFNGNLDEYLFRSREGDNKPISRVTAYRILKGAADAVGIDDVGTHSLRKTFAYHFFKNTGDIATLQNALNHDSQADTLRYIGVEHDKIDEAIESYSIISKSLLI